MYLYSGLLEDLYIDKSSKLYLFDIKKKDLEFRYIVYVDIKYYMSLDKAWIYQAFYSLVFFLTVRPTYLRLWFKKSHKPRQYRGLLFKGYHGYNSLGYLLNLTKLVKKYIRYWEEEKKCGYILIYSNLNFIYNYDMKLVLFRWDQKINLSFCKDDKVVFAKLIFFYSQNRNN